MSPGETAGNETVCAATDAPRLRGSLGWWYLFAMATASILGPWIVMSQFWYSVSGPGIAFAFVVVGLLCVPIGLVYGELITMFPNAGGSYTYIMKGFGKEAAYWVTWALLLSYLALMAFMVMAFAQIVTYIWLPEDQTLLVIGVGGALLATATLLLLMRKVDLGATVQFILFLFTVIIGAIAILLFFGSAQFNTANWEPLLPNGIDGFISGVALMVTMYFGFELVPHFAEECKYPHESLWKVMVWSIVSAMAIYFFICLSETGMAPTSDLLNPDLFPNFIGFILARQAYGDWLAIPLALANIATLISCILGFWLGSARVMFAMSRDGILPKQFEKLNKNAQPWVANVVIFLITLAFIGLSGSDWIAQFFILMAIGVAIAYTGSSLSFVKLRFTAKDLPRPWKTPGGVAMGVLAVIAGGFIVINVFRTFMDQTWILFLLYFAIGLVIRIVLLFQVRSHPERFATVGQEKT